MLNLRTVFDLQNDVFSHILGTELPLLRLNEANSIPEADARILNVERDGSILYSWNEAPGTTRIGKFDPGTRQHKLLYAFDKEVSVSSCSLNKEETLLAVSLSQRSRREGRLREVPKCLTLLIEIQPVNNTKVLKALECRVKVQFLHPDPAKTSLLESHLLLIAEDGYVEQFHILMVKQEGYRVVIQNPERLVKDRLAEEVSWVQWDGETQRLFYLTSREKYMLKCVQFYPDYICETMFELPLEFSANPFTSMRFVNLGYDHYKDQESEDEGLKLVVFTSKTGSMCVCYSEPVRANEDVTYTIAFVHRGHRKTYTVVKVGAALCKAPDLLFIQLDYYIVVYLAGHFIHLINTRQQDLLCYSLFLSGEDARLGSVEPGSMLLTLPEATLLDVRSGVMYRAELSHAFLLDVLHRSRLDARRMASLHCLLGHVVPGSELELKIIDWICDNVMALETFDQIQEFILASLYRMMYQQSPSLDSMEVLPYSSVFDRRAVPEGLTEIPGVRCSSEFLSQPVFGGKARSLPGYWEELQWSMERMKYFEAVPNRRYRPSRIQAEWTRLLADLNSEDMKTSKNTQNIEKNTKKVLTMLDTWQSDKKVVPSFQGEDQQQRALIGLMVEKLSEHMNRHLPRLGKKKIEKLVVNYVARLLQLVGHTLDTVWLKYRLGPQVLTLKQRGNSAEWAVFHVMCRILEATTELCLPLPSGYHTLLAVLGMRCLSRHTFLQYVDHGLLQLTEPFVSRLMTDLDNRGENEELKFSIMKRLPESMEQKIYQLWDHPITSACISRNYVRGLLEKHSKTKGSLSLEQEKSRLLYDFLPLTYLAKILEEVENQALNPFEEQDNVDARFVEETALKQTVILLGLEDK